MPEFKSSRGGVGENSVSEGKIYLVDGYPFCKDHGHINKITEKGIWRCLQISKVLAKGKKGNPLFNHDGYLGEVEVCRAGCYELKNM